jgi:hypothetical protein
MLIKEIKYWLFTVFILWAMKVLPKECTKTQMWLLKMPIDELNTKPKQEITQEP